MPPWEQDFDAYLAQLDEDQASFLIDLAAYAHAPVAELPTRVQVRVVMAAPREDGLRSSEEGPALAALEDRIVELLAASIGAVCVGHIITTGVLHVVCYAAPERIRKPEALLDELEAGDYDVGWFVEDDAEWGMYLEFLYPDPRSMQIIQNRRMLKLRAEHGDDPSAVRVLDHTAVFEDRESALTASAALNAAGFRVDEPERDDEYWLLQFHREDSLADDAPNQICLELFDLLEEHGGHYDGWGAQIVRAPLN